MRGYEWRHEGRAQLELHSFFTSALDGGEQINAPAASLQEK